MLGIYHLAPYLQVTWQRTVDDLKKKYKVNDEKKSLEILELQSEVTDLIKHLEIQSAVGNVEHGIKEVRCFYLHQARVVLKQLFVWRFVIGVVFAVSWCCWFTIHVVVVIITLLRWR